MTLFSACVTQAREACNGPTSCESWLIDGVVHLYADVFAVAGGQLQAVAPEVRLGLKANCFFAFDARCFFNIHGDRQPLSGLHIHAPTVEVEVVLARILFIWPRVGAVEADNIAVLIFDPDAAEEAAHAFDFWDARRRPRCEPSRETPAHIAEHVVVLVEARWGQGTSSA
jgi:hypothetical protein